MSFCEAFFGVHVEALVFNRGTAGVDGEYYRHGRSGVMYRFEMA